MTSNAPITDKVRQYLGEKLGGLFPKAPIVVEERRTECPTNDTRQPRLKKGKTKAIGLHTVAQVAARRSGGPKAPSLKVQPTRIISRVPYPKWKTDADGTIIPSVCTRKGNGLGNLGVPFIEYSGGVHPLKNPPQGKVGKKVIGFGKRKVTYAEELPKSEYVAKVHVPRKDYEVEEAAPVIVTPAQRAANKAAAALVIRSNAVDKEIQKELSTEVMYTPTWRGPTGNAATVPRRDKKPVSKAPKIFRGVSKKRKNKKVHAKAAPKVSLNPSTKPYRMPLDVRPTMEAKRAERVARRLLKVTVI
jgi:hypothetical protein